MKNLGGPLALSGLVAIALSSGLVKNFMAPPRQPNNYEESNDLPGGSVPSNSSSQNSGSNSNPNQNPEGGVPPGDGSQEWRATTDRDPEALRSHLPDHAKHLADDFVEAGKLYNIDPAFLQSISAHETGQWTSNAFNNRNNAMGVSNSSGVVNQTSHRDSIFNTARSLAGAQGTQGYYTNARTISDVGAIYAPVGATNDPNSLNGHWANNVSGFYNRYTN